MKSSNCWLFLINLHMLVMARVIKYGVNFFAAILTKLFYARIKQAVVPNHWKPLFKGKGARDGLDNYQICFKGLLHWLYGLFADQQQDFRTYHSCETAFHSILDLCELSVSQKKVNLAIFIDFKKSFVLINPRLLFLKMFHYGFY